MDIAMAVAQLAESRALLQQLREQLAESRKEWEVQNADLIDQEGRVAAIAKSTEAAVRGLVEDQFRVTGDKHPAPGVEVKERTVVIYAARQAREWALQNAPHLLTLDAKGLEAWAKAATEAARPAWVEVKKEPVASIATDLVKAGYTIGGPEPVGVGAAVEEYPPDLPF